MEQEKFIPEIRFQIHPRKFLYDGKLGYVTSSLASLGTGLSVCVRVCARVVTPRRVRRICQMNGLTAKEVSSGDMAEQFLVNTD